MSGTPIYSEEHGSGNKKALWATFLFGVCFSLLLIGFIYFFIESIRGFPLLPFNVDYLKIFFIVAVILINAWYARAILKSARTKQVVEFYPDRIVVKSKGEVKEIPYKGIRRVWKGRILGNSGRIGSAFFPPLYFVEQYPGLKVPAREFLPGSEMREAGAKELLVWNAKIVFGLALLFRVTVLILEQENEKRVLLLEVKDEGKIVDLLKRQAPSIEFSPIFEK